jgi:transposase-like protein
MVNVFKWRHFQGVIILQCVLWYLKYGISYRDLEQMMKERGVEVDHSTLYRWVMKYAHELKKRSSWYGRSHGFSWRVDET